MFNLISKAFLHFIEEELIKLEPEVQTFLLNELNIMATNLFNFVDKKLVLNGDKNNVG